MTEPYVCPECGLDYDTISPSDAAVALRSFPRRYAEQLHRSDGDEAALRRRPEPSVWSALEYTAHVGDSYDVFADIVRRMRAESNPELDFFDPDQRAEHKRYNEQDVHAMLGQLEANALRFADAVDAVGTEDLDRTARFAWGERDLLTMIRNGVHEGKHHLRDIERGLDKVL